MYINGTCWVVETGITWWGWHLVGNGSCRFVAGGLDVKNGACWMVGAGSNWQGLAFGGNVDGDVADGGVRCIKMALAGC